MRKKKVVRLITIGLHAKESEYLTRADQDGHEITGLIRELIRDWGAKEYPPTPAYVEPMLKRAELRERELAMKEQIENQSPEEYATEVLRAKIHDGFACFITPHGNIMRVPLSEVKSLTPENTEYIQRHFQVLDNTWKWINGRPLDEIELQRINEAWNHNPPMNWEDVQRLKGKPPVDPDEYLDQMLDGAFDDINNINNNPKTEE